MVRRPGQRRCGFTLIEVIISGIILAIGMTALLTLTSRALAMQRRGERKIVAASILDELLGSVLTEGPHDFVKLHSTSGPCEPPFDDWEYKVEIDDSVGMDPFRILAEVISPDGHVYECATLIAPKLGEEPDPDRFPPEPIDREARWAEIEDEKQQ